MYPFSLLPPPHTILSLDAWGPPAQSRVELAPAPGLQWNRAAVWISAAEWTRWNIHQFITALCIRKNVFQTAAPLSAVLLGRCMNTPCSICSSRVLVCYVFAKLMKIPINCGSTLEVRKPEIHHFCATVTALDTIPKFSIAPDFISGELMFAAD